MSYNTDIPPSLAPTYIIYRDGEPNDATAPPVFYPPKDSDELFDALRAKFPHVKSHSDRMRDAIIEFLLEERDAEAYATTSPTVPSLYDSSIAASPWHQSWPSMSSTCQNSPETANLVTPTFGTSPHSQTPGVARQPSTVGASSTASPPALDAMTSVFSLSTSEQPKQRVRGKMTEAEKVEYRKRRIVKACDKCAKRKRKCNHNTPDDSPNTPAANAKPVQKVKKARTSNKKASDKSWPFTPSAAIAPYEDFEALKHHDPISSYTQDADFEDFTTLLDDPLPEMNFDDLVDFNQHYDLANSSQYNNAPMAVDPSLSQWPWSDAQDWTLLDSTSDHTFAPQGDTLGDVSGSAYSSGSNSPQVLPQLEGTTGRQGIANHDRVLADHHTLATNHEHILPSRLEVNSGRIAMSEVVSPGSGSGTQGREVYQTPSSSTSSGDSSASGSGNGMLWEHLRTGQHQTQASQTSQQASQQTLPTDGSSDLLPVDDGRRVSTGVVEGGQGGPSRSKTALAGTVLQTQGTMRTPRAATGLFSPRSSRVSRSSTGVAGAENAGVRLDSNQSSTRNNALLATRDRLLETEGALLARPASSADTGTQWRTQTTQASANRTTHAVLATPASAASRQGLANPPDLILPRLATTSALSTSPSPFDDKRRGAGFSGANTALLARESSTELLRLKRRIPKALHSILDRDAVAADTSRLDARATNTGGSAAYMRLLTDVYARPSAAAATPAAVALANSNANDSAATRAAVLAETHTTFRLRDTNRHRDHHGRPSFTAAALPAMPVMSAAAACFWGVMAVLCATLLCTTGQSASWVVLAFCALPVPGTGCTPGFASGTNVGSAIRCSGKNSSWLFRMARMAGAPDGGRKCMGKKKVRGMGVWSGMRAAGCSALAVV